MNISGNNQYFSLMGTGNRGSQAKEKVKGSHDPK